MSVSTNSPVEAEKDIARDHEDGDPEMNVQCKIEVNEGETVQTVSVPLIFIKQELTCEGSSGESPNADGECASEPTDELAQLPTNIFQCSVCEFVTKSEDELEEHKTLCHAQTERIYGHVCARCGESFERKSDYENHLVCHQVPRPYACLKCGKLFVRKHEYNIHVLDHQEERTHKCPICGSGFLRSSGLSNHIKIHNYVPPRGTLVAASGNANGASKGKASTQQTLPREKSKEPIPSFETLPAPSYSFHNYVNNFDSANNANNNWDSEFEPNKDVNCSGSEKMTESEKSEIDVSGGNGGASNNFQASYQFNLNQEGDDEDITLRDPSFLTVKEVGLLYGIKVEDQVSSPEMLDEQSEAPEVQSTLKEVGLLYGIKVENQVPSPEMLDEQSEAPEIQSTSGAERQLKRKIVVKEDFATGRKFRKVQNIAGSSDSKPHTCTICNIYFSRLKAYESHMRLHSDNWEIPSNEDLVQLQANTVNKINIIKPNIEDTPGYGDLKFGCLECPKRFPTKQKLNRHVWVHRKKTYSCEICACVFEEQSDVDAHRLAVHPPSRFSRFSCQDCGKSFTSRQSLWEHSRVHTAKGLEGASLLACNICGKTFSSRQGHKIHNRTHTGEKPYSCKYCDKTFRDGATMRKHERIHTGERPHVCPLCSKAFNQKVVLREHVRSVHATPTDPNPQCTICQAMFQDYNEFSVHILKHSDELSALVRSAMKELCFPEIKVKVESSDDRSFENQHDIFENME